LIEHLKEIIRTNRHPAGDSSLHRQRASPPATEEEVTQAEMQLGFALPSLLRRVYLEVGNGGFGPGYGFYPLNTHHLSTDSLVTTYLGMRSLSQKDIDEHWADDEVKPSLWPEQVLMLCD
jgi:cell wall assembly regulator SMI1